MNIWVLGTLNQLFIKVLILEQNFQKNKVATGKTAFFVIGPFCTPHSICLRGQFWEGNFVYVTLFEKGFRFSENLFQG